MPDGHYKITNGQMECSVFVSGGVINTTQSSAFWAARNVWGKTPEDAKTYLSSQGFTMEPSDGPVAYRRLPG